VLIKSYKERTYFDSGDFALSAGNCEMDNGAIQTGKEHPHRGSISHPYAAMPVASNVDKNANEDLYRKSASPAMSPLLQQTNFKDQGSIEDEGQEKPACQEC
jgi:hypothetical protein